jgi:hypothetical protein
LMNIRTALTVSRPSAANSFKVGFAPESHQQLCNGHDEHTLTCFRTEYGNWHVQYIRNASVSTRAARSTMNLPMAIPGRWLLYYVSVPEAPRNLLILTSPAVEKIPKGKFSIEKS